MIWREGVGGTANTGVKESSDSRSSQHRAVLTRLAESTGGVSYTVGGAAAPPTLYLYFCICICILTANKHTTQ